MAKRTLQIDVVNILEQFGMQVAECKIIIDGRASLFYTTKANYEALMYDGVFIRDGKEPDSANVLNTTRVFEEKS